MDVCPWALLGLWDTASSCLSPVHFCMSAVSPSIPCSATTTVLSGEYVHEWLLQSSSVNFSIYSANEPPVRASLNRGLVEIEDKVPRLLSWWFTVNSLLRPYDATRLRCPNPLHPLDGSRGHRLFLGGNRSGLCKGHSRIIQVIYDFIGKQEKLLSQEKYALNQQQREIDMRGDTVGCFREVVTTSRDLMAGMLDRAHRCFGRIATCEKYWFSPLRLFV